MLIFIMLISDFWLAWQRHALRTSGQVWIDAQPPRAGGPEAGSNIQQHPVKVMTSFKTIEDEIPEAVPAPPPAIPPVLPQPKQETRPEVKPEVRNLTLDELYAQCEQLAESLSNPEVCPEVAPEVTSSDDEEPEVENEAEILDMTSEQVSISCDSWTGVRHLTIHEEEETGTGTGSSTPQPHHLNEYYSPKYIEVEEPEVPVPTQDSCLQVNNQKSNQFNSIKSIKSNHQIFNLMLIQFQTQ